MGEDRYYFIESFEYIVSNDGFDNYETETADMEVEAIWDDLEEGYVFHIFCADEDKLSDYEGNGTLEDFFEEQVRSEVENKLWLEGIETESISQKSPERI